MSWQRRLYAKKEPSKAFRWTTTLGGVAVIGIGVALLAYGGRLTNGAGTDVAVGSVLLILSLPVFFAGLGVILLAWMRWTNPTL